MSGVKGIALLAFAWAILALGQAPEARAALPEPVTASPGSTTRVAPIAEACPVFSWGAVAGAATYELVVYSFDEPGRELAPVLRESLPGSVRSWTPPLDRCLGSSGRYAWMVRGVGEDDSSGWSEPRLFALVAGRSGDQRNLRAEGASAPDPARREQGSLSPRDWRKTGAPSATVEPADRGGAEATPGPTEIGIQSSISDVSSGYAARIGVLGSAGESGSNVEEHSIGVKGVSTSDFGAGVRADGMLGIYATSTNTSPYGGVAGWLKGNNGAQGLWVDSQACCDGSSMGSYAAAISNNATGAGVNPDALALYVGIGTPEVSSNFIGFFDYKFNSGPRLIGEIEGDGLGGVRFTGSAASVSGGGADFAEYLPRLDPDVPLLPGDVVGLHGDAVGHRVTPS